MTLIRIRHQSAPTVRDRCFSHAIQLVQLVVVVGRLSSSVHALCTVYIVHAIQNKNNPTNNEDDEQSLSFLA